MDFGGRYRIAASRVLVWEALNNPEMLKAAIPGCSHIGWTGPETLDLAITVNLGVVKPVFKGELVLTNVVPAASYTLAGKGKGGLLGLAEGAAVLFRHRGRGSWHPERAWQHPAARRVDAGRGCFGPSGGASCRLTGSGSRCFWVAFWG